MFNEASSGYPSATTSINESARQQVVCALKTLYEGIVDHRFMREMLDHDSELQGFRTQVTEYSYLSSGATLILFEQDCLLRTSIFSLQQFQRWACFNINLEKLLRTFQASIQQVNYQYQEGDKLLQEAVTHWLKKWKVLQSSVTTLRNTPPSKGQHSDSGLAHDSPEAKQMREEFFNSLGVNAYTPTTKEKVGSTLRKVASWASSPHSGTPQNMIHAKGPSSEVPQSPASLQGSFASNGVSSKTSVKESFQRFLCDLSKPPLETNHNQSTQSVPTTIKTKEQAFQKIYAHVKSTNMPAYLSLLILSLKVAAIRRNLVMSKNKLSSTIEEFIFKAVNDQAAYTYSFEDHADVRAQQLMTKIRSIQIDKDFFGQGRHVNQASALNVLSINGIFTPAYGYSVEAESIYREVDRLMIPMQ